MSTNADANWWQFSLDAQIRRTKIKGGVNGLEEVNPILPDGRRLLDYHTYIGLEKLLSCQVPSSMIPDERCFIITHQLFELVFKLMVFDLTVVAETLRQLLEIPFDGSFHSLCTTSAANSTFWQPALTASGRIKYSSRVLLPTFIGYLAKDETFSSLEFYCFRDYLPPASGFQSAQFRLIQRALGKANLLGVKLFPAAEYWKNYESQDDQRPMRVIDPVILREDTQIADPPTDSRSAHTASLDEYAHQVLERLSKFGGIEPDTANIRLITENEIEQAIDSFRRILSSHRSQQERAGKKPADADEKDRAADSIFRESLERAVQAENERRALMKLARTGAFYLHYIAPRSHLAQVLNHLVSADSALHGRQEDSFISLHYRLARERIQDIVEYAKQVGEPEPPSGTGGGGVPYLGHMRKNLIPLFPALIAYLDLEDSPTFSWIE